MERAEKIKVIIIIRNDNKIEWEREREELWWEKARKKVDMEEKEREELSIRTEIMKLKETKRK